MCGVLYLRMKRRHSNPGKSQIHDGNWEEKTTIIGMHYYFRLVALVAEVFRY